MPQTNDEIDNAARLHDLTVGDFDGADPVARLAEETVRLRAVVAELERELSDAGTRATELADAERRRMERDLHDGAQQRMLVLALKLRQARIRIDAGDENAAGVLVDDAMLDLESATRDLRELARGAHPRVLADQGLAAAVSELAGSTPLDVRVVSLPDRRLAARIESTAYFVVAEAVANVLRHAQASFIEIAIRSQAGATIVEIRDNGVGGADARRGSGLDGLRDRVVALDGRLDVMSPLGSGTLIRATLRTPRLTLVSEPSPVDTVPASA